MLTAHIVLKFTQGYIGTGGSSLKDFWEYTPDSTNNINELSNAINVSVFPNPTSGQIQVGIGQYAVGKEYKIEIYNVYGEKVYSLIHPFTHSLINLSEANNGIYFIHLVSEKSGEAVMTKK